MKTNLSSAMPEQAFELTLNQELTAALSKVHASWLPILEQALRAVHKADPGYLPGLVEGQYLPTQGRLFAAFAQPLHEVRYVLIGEGPYPREESATGVCFMDGAVRELWSQEQGGGLSKKVNRATSLRNFMKMLLVADGRLSSANTTGVAMAAIAEQARTPGSGFIQTLPELQQNLSRSGFLLLNASLVYRDTVAPLKDAKAWQPFLRTVLEGMLQHAEKSTLPQLLLWGKIAEQLRLIDVSKAFLQITAEHPYNLSFIANEAMHSLFAPMRLLQKA